MSELTFSDRPHIPLLQWLARGSLKQNLLRAIRLWVWLCNLYSDRTTPLQHAFTYATWRDAFFTPTHPKGEAIPLLHDSNCACAKTTREWLFNSITGVSEFEWKRSLLAHDDIPDLDKLLQQRLFGVTRRSLAGDLYILEQLGWLQRQDNKYYRVKKFPAYPTEFTSINSPPTTNEDLDFILQHLSQPIAPPRFFLDLPYIVGRDKHDKVEDWQAQLTQFWQQHPIPPIQIVYNSAKEKERVNCIVYPVCVYYAQRAIYLSAFGQTPNRQSQWYNYRLDKIEQMTELKWTDAEIPHFILEKYQQKNLPTSDYTKEQKEIAWGFDFYLPAKIMLLRFDREFGDRYIKGTFRHDTFTKITYQEAENLIRQHVPATDQQKLLKILQSRPRDDAYYRVEYRDGDTDVGLRLRSWRPKSEVILPLELRQEIAKEVAAEAKLYLQD